MNNIRIAILFQFAKMNAFVFYKSFLPVFIGITGLLLSGPNLLFAQPSAENGIPSHITDTILIGSEPNYPPYCIIDENGNAAGFAVDIFKAAAAAAGFEVKISLGLWTDIREDLLAGRIDALPIIGRTPERENLYDFSLAYLSLNGAVFVRKGENKIRSFEDLRNKEILVMKNDNAEEFVRREKLTEKIFTTTTVQVAFLELANGRHDAVLVQHITGLEVLNELGIQSIEALDIQIPRFRVDYCFGVQKGNTELLSKLNEGLSIVIAGNAYRDIHYTYFGPEDTFTKDIQNIAKTVVFVLIPIIFVFVLLWIYFLRKQVNKRTLRLNTEIEEHKTTLNSLKEQQKKLKESEEQIRLLLNSTAEGIYAIDTAGNCTLINKAALLTLGYSTRIEVLGKNMHQLIHHTRTDGSECKVEACEIYKAFRKGTGTHRDDEIFWKADGTSFPVEFFSYPIRKNGIVTGSVITFRDITERKEAENELIRLKKNLEKEVNQRTAELADKVQKLDRSQRAMLYMVEDLNHITSELKQERTKLEAANTELEAFTYSVSHDLRAPLRAINGYSGFLLEDYAEQLDDEGKRFIHTIAENASKMDRLITDLLNLSRVSRSSLNITKTNMKQLALAILHETASEEEKKSFEITVGNLPPAFCDASLTKQVWHNLIGNALKYSAKSNTKQIEIGASENSAEVIYYVKDAGIGFDEKFKEKIFGVFQRLHRDNEFEGSGVGLAIAQRIVQRQGGKVWATGNPGKGATFYFSFPKISGR
jgi:PAS domain S-box-containing protein